MTPADEPLVRGPWTGDAGSLVERFGAYGLRPTDPAGAVLLAAMVYAPLAMGSQPPWASRRLHAAAAVAVVAWIVGVAAERRRPRLPVPLVVAVLAVLALGWASALFPRSVYNPVARLFAPAGGGWPPGTVDGTTSLLAMTQVSVLLAAMLMACDLVGRRWFRLALLCTAAATGVTIAVLGIAQKVGVSALALGAMDRYEGIPFATFNYHGNAGSFLNLALPAAAALAVLGVRRQWSPAARAGTWLAMVILVVGTVMTTSKGALAVTVFLLAALAVVMPSLVSVWRARPWTSRLAAAVMVGAVVTGVVATSVERWRGVGAEAGNSGFRVSMWKAAGQMFGDDPWFGYGPGAYKIVLPTSPYVDNRLRGISIVRAPRPGAPVSMWSNVHEDYLQTLVEWGLVGSLAWAGVVGGGLRALWRATRRVPAGSEDRVLLVGAGLALAGLLAHALVDFPLQVPSLQLYVAVFLGLAWGSAVIARSEGGHADTVPCRAGDLGTATAADRSMARDCTGRALGEGT